jgi:hypothetical protein
MSFRFYLFFKNFSYFAWTIYKDFILTFYNLFFYINFFNILDLSFIKVTLRNITINNFGILNTTLLDFNNFYFNKKLKHGLNYSVNDSNLESENFLTNSFLETSSSQRFTRFSNVLVNYDYKTGNYIGNWDKQYPFLMLSLIEVASGIRKPSWFFSEQYIELIKKNYDKFFTNFNEKNKFKAI